MVLEPGTSESQREFTAETFLNFGFKFLLRYQECQEFLIEHIQRIQLLATNNEYIRLIFQF